MAIDILEYELKYKSDPMVMRLLEEYRILSDSEIDIKKRKRIVQNAVDKLESILMGLK